MRKTLFWIVATLSSTMTGPAVAEEGFTSHTLLSFPPNQQESFFNTSLITAHAIAHAISEDLASCIETYLLDESNTRYSRFRAALEKQRNGYPPIVLRDAIIQSCGAFHP